MASAAQRLPSNPAPLQSIGCPSSGDSHFAEHLYRKQTSAGCWEGPFAFLVKDAALGDVGDHIAFAAIGEAAKAICDDYEDLFGHALGEAYCDLTKPCLVTFTRPGNWHPAVASALNYAYRMVGNLRYARECNTCFDGKGVAVPREWIDDVQWLTGKTQVKR